MILFWDFPIRKNEKFLKIFPYFTKNIILSHIQVSIFWKNDYIQKIGKISAFLTKKFLKNSWKFVNFFEKNDGIIMKYPIFHEKILNASIIPDIGIIQKHFDLGFLQAVWKKFQKQIFYTKEPQTHFLFQIIINEKNMKKNF